MPLFRRSRGFLTFIQQHRLQIAVTIFLLGVLGLGEYFWLHHSGNPGLVRRETQGTVDYPALRDEVQQYLSQKQGVSYSFYFEYIPSHISIKLDSDNLGKAASLLKLPTAMNLYRQAELGNINLDKTVALQQSWLDPDFGNLYKKGAGYRLSLRDAARIMLVDSDNTALHAIQANLPQNLSAEQNVSDFLDLPITDGSKISSEEYTDYLRCLYYSCFLKDSDSTQILTWLTDTHFPGIQSGIPQGTPVADKIGVDPGEDNDCGIVYLAHSNYFLCILLKGDDPNLNQYIGAVSSMVYQGVVGGTSLAPTR